MMQNQLKQLIDQGHAFEAFQQANYFSVFFSVRLYLFDILFPQALHMNNLNMVLYVCSRVDAKRIFSIMPCVFPQNVLLALIQQLSVDLGSATELKLK